MNNVVIDKVDEVLERLVINDNMFTAFDVTSIVRRELGKGVNVYHQIVKNHIESKFKNNDISNYSRSIISICPNSCWLYHPYNGDINSYDHEWSDIMGVSSVNQLNKTNKNEKLFVGKDNRLNIPVEIVKKANMLPSTVVGVFDKDGNIIITKDILSNPCTPLIVNADGRIRIGGKILQKISKVLDQFSVKLDNGNIIVEIV
jgi:hypothetical protein